MRVILQRVSRASVTVEETVISSIGNGVLILLGITDEDDQEDVRWLVRKIANLRIFNDTDGVMNLSLLDIKGDAIVVSQFTLYGATKKGNRPSYVKAAKPDIAVPLYDAFVLELNNTLGRKVGTGVFGADMKVELLNDGPVTIFMDTKNKE